MRSDYLRTDQVAAALLPPFHRLAASDRVTAHVSQYYFDADLFDAYERDHEARVGETEWDLPAIRSAVPDGAAVLEVGCGMGRVLVDLAATTSAGRLVGIDTSAPALERAQAKLAGQAGRVELVHGDFLAHDFGEDFDTVILADCTLNGFTEESAAHAVLRRARDLTRPGGLVVVSIFADGAREVLSRQIGRFTLDLFTDPHGTARLIYWAMHYDEADGLLHRSAMVERPELAGDGRVHVQLGDLNDRIWTPQTLAGVIGRAGLATVTAVPGAVDGGAAQGTATVTLKLAPAG